MTEETTNQTEQNIAEGEGRESFINQYVEIVKNDGVNAADDWAKTQFGGGIPQEVVASLAAEVRERLEKDGINVNDLQKSSESSAEGAQEAQEETRTEGTDTTEEATGDNTEASEEA